MKFKRQKNVKRLLSLMLATVMAVGSLTACGDSETVKQAESKTESSVAASESKEAVASSEAEPESEGVTYPIEGDVTLTLAIVEEAAVTSSGAANLFETPFGKAWQEAAGVTIEVMQLADNDAMNLLLAGGDLPDLIYYRFGTLYTGGVAKAVKDKIIEPLNDYVEYLPDMMAALESDPDYIKGATTDEGDIVGAPFVRGDAVLRTSVGMMLRQDWLDDLNMDMPQTPDELYDVLKAFKDEKGAEVPMSISSGAIESQMLKEGLITSPFGLPQCDYYQEDGTVHYGFYEQEYKDVLAWLNKLYTDGLLDPNFQTIDNATRNANIMNGVSGMTCGSIGSGLGTYINTMAETDPEYNLSGLAPLVAKEGDVPMCTYYDTAVTGYFLVMTPACENKEAAAKFLNYGYTEEGQMLFNYGIEGESYTMVDGYPTYTDLIMSNPDGLTVQQAMAQYQRAWKDGPFVQQKEYIEQYYTLEQQQEALKAYTVSDAAKYQLPAITAAEEEAAEFSKLTADITAYVSEMLIKYIKGEKTLDTFETEYLPTLKGMGVERVLEIYQDALDRYNAR